MRPVLALLARCSAGVLLLTLAAPMAAAQFGVGFVGGVNSSAFDGATGAELDGAAGAQGGVFVDVGSIPIALRVGLTYVSAGTIAAVPVEVEVTPDPRQPDMSVVLSDTLASGYELSFLAIPIELHYRFRETGAVPYALLGPELRFPIGTQGDDLEDVALSTTVAFSIAGGVLFDRPSGPGFFAEARYTADVSGFTNKGRVDPDGVAGPFPEFEIESYQVNLFSLRAGIIF